MKKKDDTTMFVYALHTVEQGKPFSRSVCLDGDGESGPMALNFVGVRWGRVELYVTPNGSVVLSLDDGRGPYPQIYFPVYDSSMSWANTTLGLEIRRRLFERIGKHDYKRRHLPGSTTLRERQERIASLGKHYNPEVTKL